MGRKHRPILYPSSGEEIGTDLQTARPMQVLAFAPSTLLTYASLMLVVREQHGFLIHHSKDG